MSVVRTWFPLTTILLLLTPCLSHSVLSNFRSDGFSENVLHNLTNFEVDAVAHSVVTLNDSSVVITGLLRYPPGVAVHPSFVDEDDLAASELSTDRHRFAGMILRVLPNGSVAWAKRTMLCTFETTFTVAYDGLHVYVAGGSVGVPDEGGRLSAGRVLMRYHVNGTRDKFVRHGENGERYTFISYTDSKADTLFLVSCAPSSAAVYQNRGEKRPLENGLLVHRIGKRDMEIVQTEFVSDSSSVEGTLIKDTFWDMAVSIDGENIFISAYRKTMRFGVTNLPAVFSIKSSDLSTRYTRNMENKLQLDMHVATRRSSEGVYVSYVDRTANKEFLVIERLTSALIMSPWAGGAAGAFRYRILIQGEILRETVSSVRALDVDEGGTVRALLHSAEVVNATLASASPPPSLAIHRQLKNGRPAVVAVAADRTVGGVVQAQTEQRWEALAMRAARDAYVMVGADRGLVNGGASRVLLTGVRREAGANETDRGAAEASPETEDAVEATMAPEGAGVECVGTSTRIGGKGIREIVRDDARLRMQTHPGRARAGVRVWCYGWSNGTADVVCATADHVVRHWGRVMYMREFCGVVGCEQRVEEVVNFKGTVGCRDDVAAHVGLSVTMHAGGSDAESVVRDECRLMAGWWSRWLWRLTSL